MNSNGRKRRTRLEKRGRIVVKRNERKNKKELEQRGNELEKERERCREKRRRISDEQRKRERERKRENRRRDNSSNAERRERYAGEKFNFCFNKSQSKALCPVTGNCVSSFVFLHQSLCVICQTVKTMASHFFPHVWIYRLSGTFF